MFLVRFGFQLSTYLSIYPSFFLSKTLYRELGLVRPRQEFFEVSYLSIYLSFYLVVCLSTYLSIYLSKTLYRELGMVRPRQEFLNVSYLSIYLSFYLSIYLAIQLAIQLSSYLAIQLCIYLSKTLCRGFICLDLTAARLWFKTVEHLLGMISSILGSCGSGKF